MALSRDDIRTIVGIMGNVISIILFLSPVPTFYRILKRKSVEQYSAMPYVATFFNCCLWVLYGLPMVQPHSMLVVTVNGTGFAIEVVYLAIFLMFSTHKYRLRLVALVVAVCLFVAALSLSVLLAVHTANIRSKIVGSLCLAGNIFMYASPLTVMKLVLRTKSVEFMPFYISLFCFFNGICWTIYSLMKLDLFILIPNASGVALGFSQLVIYALFYKNTQRIIAQRKEEGEETVVMGKIEAERNHNGVV